ncbi:hypothetical protein SAMN05192559_11048 [Halobacillus karajensis]|uniref:Uncharacterized protein n=1 Tax=Halobacillus karajensis TaxID=195088 RepID=A0A024P8C4_9BACI|nr:hypothetical protein [Halobacillus karajensis]CDQ21429.1 hypothetical protein BN982_03815 [Halobacillus karajensis]CDQ25364.1 hypothetical protein BN983_03695 [Halobacillus karajensis]CDQ29688.1 hypothetical protein BN981_04109 [Halobacillus karajensis]SEI07514.1 hypothetical protein SAMN05192559_11048 [Halobacillus karajensis]
MPAWISNSLKILSTIVMHIVVTLFLFGAIVYTIFTGLTVFKGLIVIGLFFLWVISFICIVMKLYEYLFGRWKNDHE